MYDPNEPGCTGNCHSCHSSCETDEPRGKSFFDKMEEFSKIFDDIGEEEILRIIHETVSEWEAEDAEAEAQTSTES